MQSSTASALLVDMFSPGQDEFPKGMTSGIGGGPLGEGAKGLPALPDPGLLLLNKDALMAPAPACCSTPQQQHLTRLLDHRRAGYSK